MLQGTKGIFLSISRNVSIASGSDLRDKQILSTCPLCLPSLYFRAAYEGPDPDYNAAQVTPSSVNALC
jgi:hypothetical protein